MNPVHEAKDVDVSEVSKRLSVWHTLPVEASSALLTLYPPEELAKLGSIWAGTLGLGWLIKSLILPAWWDTMKTRPEAGRFGVKLEGSGKVRVFAIGNPIWQIGEVLSRLATDGTFDQLLPAQRKDAFAFIRPSSCY
ncbi:hypothetical protein MA16_Dca027626 [Dendrobium catenatum]|uniref:Uncharacterized protein n=1 Tax=Dendrobium catenatum TaxID=906689 RepID=A0A2I0VAB7_9ASPA|nr:hypothetical protein MA16_Dca027626 [Dendrobium catenatum]